MKHSQHTVLSFDRSVLKKRESVSFAVVTLSQFIEEQDQVGCQLQVDAGKD